MPRFRQFNQWEKIMSNKVSIRQASRMLEKLITTLGPSGRYLLMGAPGVAKSSIMRQLAAKLGYTLVDIRLAMLSPEQIAGYPYLDNGVMKYALPDWFPAGDKILLFVDELGQAPIAVQNVALQLILDRRVGGHHLPADCIIVGATNRPEDRAGAGALTTALYSRFTTVVTIEPEKAEVIDYFNSIGVNALLTAWIERMLDSVLQFDPREKGGQRSPRTLEEAGKLLTVYENDADHPDLSAALHGVIGSADAASLLAFIATVNSMPTYAEILADPETAAMDVALVGPIAGIIAANLKYAHVPKVMRYVWRFPKEQQATMLASMPLDHPDIDDARKALKMA